MKSSSKSATRKLSRSTANHAAMSKHHQLSYRLPLKVAELMVFSSSFGRTAYYVCPRCHNTMEREYQSFCDRCGQRLDWSNCRNAKIVYPCMEQGD